MEPGDTMPYSQVPYSNCCPEPNQSSHRIYTYSFKIYSNIVQYIFLYLPRNLFPVGLSAKILKALPPSSILATRPVHINLRRDYINYIWWKIQAIKFLVVKSSQFPISHPFWAQKFVSESCVQMPLVLVLQCFTII